MPSLETTAVNDPADVGRFVNVTVSDEVVAEMTVPVAPRLRKVTTSLLADGSKPAPVIVNVVEPSRNVVVVGKITGLMTEATSAVLLVAVSTTRLAVNGPNDGGVVMTT